MPERKSKPDVQWDELHASTDFRELFRFTKGDVVRIYNLRVLPTGDAEVWVNQQRGEHVATLATHPFTAPATAITWLESQKEELTANGWTKASSRRQGE